MRKLAGIWAIIAIFAASMAVSAQDDELFEETDSTTSPEPRIALIVGVSDYAAAPSLRNPANDARLIAGVLEELNFDVRLEIDPDLRRMQDAVIDLKLRMMAAGEEAIGLFYYAGHGIQRGGANYLIPADARLADGEYLDIEAVSANWILGVMQAAGAAANFVILDACRDDPFTRSWSSSTRAALAPGLAEMQGPRGSIIVFSTAEGQVAYDGEGSNSPFALALADEIRAPGVLIETTVRRVVAATESRTDGAQSPWVEMSFSGDFYLGGPPESARVTTGEAGLLDMNALEEMYWLEIAENDDPTGLEQYLDLFPDGAHAGEARTRLAALEAVAPAAAPDPLRVTAAEIAALPADYAGPCPANIGFSARITSEGGPGVASYRFLDSSGAATPLTALSIEAPGVTAVEHAWTVGSGDASLSGWMILEVFEPDLVRSERAAFTVRCASPTRSAESAEAASGPVEVDPGILRRAVRDPSFLDQVEQDDPALAAEIRRRIEARRAEREARRDEIVAPRQISPSDGAIFDVAGRRMVFEWAPVEGALSYGIEIDCYNCCRPGAWCADIGGRTVIDDRHAETIHTHRFVGVQPGRWRVWANMRGGRRSPMSPWRTFEHRQ